MKKPTFAEYSANNVYGVPPVKDKSYRKAAVEGGRSSGDWH